MNRITSLYDQKRKALTSLMVAVESGTKEAIDKAKLYYRIPCYSSTGTGKTDKDIEYDIRSLNIREKAANSVLKSLNNGSDSVMGTALKAAGVKRVETDEVRLTKGMCMHVANVCNITRAILHSIQDKRSQYRAGIIDASEVYLPAAPVSTIESEIVRNKAHA